jgi:cytochrome c-type biogenesis protein CcmH/NrfF
MSTSPPPDPGRIILWLLAVILVIVVVALVLSVLDVHT